MKKNFKLYIEDEKQFELYKKVVKELGFRSMSHYLWSLLEISLDPLILKLEKGEKVNE